ncbi:MAG: 3-hydroxyacyl-CoA dehydrogenase/enoyl-CoA hydratase family protein [Bacteroidia bacterium]|nr:3-hydroxyacyl-CoA dehydrogenase/enoyl-CoA hydratase family protein [Bacteroidia bacterium]
MNRKIKKAAVLGSGIMGSRIACHFANAGFEVLLLDIAPKELMEDEKKKGLTPDSSVVRNRIVNSSLKAAVDSNPSPLFKKSYASRITTGNFEDDMQKINSCDWVLEAVVENLDIKKKVFEQVESHRKHGTLVTTNTSGIPVHLMLEGRSDDFRKHFCGTHFFNPPRYLPLLEIIPTKETDESVIEFLMLFGNVVLGKTTVLCKDSPAFIANRVGVLGIMALFHDMESNGLTVEDIDKLTGPIIGRPKSATFRTCDVVGLDTLVHVANGLYQNCKDDEARELFKIPAYIQKMADNKWLGDKTKQGFYKKTKDASGKTEILSLDLKTLEYKPQSKTKFTTLDQAKNIDNLKERLKVLVAGKDAAGEFYRRSFTSLFSYVSHRIPEIADHFYQIDMAMKSGFGWELGPFEMWEALGINETVEMMEKQGHKPAAWVYDFLKEGKNSFYIYENNFRAYYQLTSKTYQIVEEQRSLVMLDKRRHATVWKNAGADVIDLGDGILGVEWHTKMNTIGGEVIEAVNKAIDIAEKDFRGLVIGNEGQNFSAGANLALIYMLAIEQEFDEIDYAIRAFQNMNMRVRYSSVPAVVAPHGLSLGGGCEMTLHADKVVAAAETYTGMVEFGVGLIPGGGGSKEFAVRFSDELKEGDIELNVLRQRFLTIGQAKVSTSAHEAFDLGILRTGHDEVCMSKSRLLTEAKNAAIRLAEAGYVRPIERKDIRVLGKSGLGMVYAGANAMLAGNYITEYDKFLSEKLGYILCGGDLSAPALVSEQYLLDLEREAFLSLCGERKTLERIQSILTTGKPLRN